MRRKGARYHGRWHLTRHGLLALRQLGQFMAESPRPACPESRPLFGGKPDQHSTEAESGGAQIRPFSSSTRSSILADRTFPAQGIVEGRQDGCAEKEGKSAAEEGLPSQTDQGAETA